MSTATQVWQRAPGSMGVRTTEQPPLPGSWLEHCQHALDSQYHYCLPDMGRGNVLSAFIILLGKGC